MQLLLIRHAIAVDLPPGSTTSDAQRPLTREGVRRFRAAARGLQRLGLVPDLIFSSPYVRARETAELLQAIAEEPPPLHLTEALLPDASLTLPTQLLKQKDSATVALVGHTPHLERLVAHILAPQAPEQVRLELKKGSCVVVELSGAPDLMHARLTALLPPRLLRFLGDQR